jgi:hypothetical protein
VPDSLTLLFFNQRYKLYVKRCAPKVLRENSKLTAGSESTSSLSQTSNCPKVHINPELDELLRLRRPVGKFTRLRRDGYALSQGCKATNDHVYAYGRARELG